MSAGQKPYISIQTNHNNAEMEINTLRRNVVNYKRKVVKFKNVRI